MYNYFDDNFYFSNIPFLRNRYMSNKDLDSPFDMAYPYISGYNPVYMPQNPNYTEPYNPYKKTNKNILNLNNDLRKLWEEHIIWTKLVIMSIASGSPDIQLVSQRLLRNANDFEKLFIPLYGPTASEKFRELLKQHLLIAADLVNAAKKKDNASVNLIEGKWYKNADEITDFLSRINPYWNKNDVKKMMYEHLVLTKSEAVSILTNKYEDSISLFDKIEEQILIMADMFTEGILKQFPNKF
ncbi:MAG: hypothetical protein PHD15_03845 [Clostridia bacterium]|nr:hypothetical protein [Clostridia bacterium]MDD4386874.1 hypothetical protein [Clostridia bacterium]